MATHGKGSLAAGALLLVVLVAAFATLEAVPVEARALDDDVEQTLHKSDDVARLIADFREAACSSAALVCEGGNALTCRGNGVRCRFNQSCCSGYCSYSGGYVCKERSASE